MKVAVSIPDGVFGEAEQLARQLQTPRSELYPRALAAFVGEHATDHVIQAINEWLFPEEGLDAFGLAAAWRVFDRTDW